MLPRTPNFDILSWWKGTGVKYPTLQCIVRDILAVPVSTVALKSPFSTNERLLGPHYNRLHPKTLEALMLPKIGCKMKLKVTKLIVQLVIKLNLYSIFFVYMI